MKKTTCWLAPYSLADEERARLFLASEDGAGAMRGGAVAFFSCPCEALASADWLAVGDSCCAAFETTVPRARRILFLMEPPEVRVYERDYLERFGVVVSPYEPRGFTGRLIRGNPCLGWWAGAGRFRKLADAENFRAEKTRALSIVSSLKGKTDGHLRRLAFLNALMERFGPEADYFGREFAPVEDKLDAIAPYKYHIVIENGRLENYWTEKLADAWVGWSLPIYCGDPSIASRVPDPAGIEIIDTDDIPAALRRIDALLRDDVYASRLSAIAKCRAWALKKASRLERICEIMETSDESVRTLPDLQTRERVSPPARSGGRGVFDLLHRVRALPRDARKKIIRRKIRQNYRRIEISRLKPI